jgi:hypothetical protein
VLALIFDWILFPYASCKDMLIAALFPALSLLTPLNHDARHCAMETVARIITWSRNVLDIYDTKEYVSYIYSLAADRFTGAATDSEIHHTSRVSRSFSQYSLRSQIQIHTSYCCFNKKISNLSMDYK